MLQQLGIIRPGYTKTAGSSIGALGQAVDHPGAPTHEEFLAKAIDFNNQCRAKRGCLQTLDAALTGLVAAVTPPDQWRRVNGKACSVWTWWAERSEDRTSDYTCNYGSNQDMIDTIRAATFVPAWSSPDDYVMFKGRPAMDGAFQQLLPCPPNVTYCIKVRWVWFLCGFF